MATNNILNVGDRVRRMTGPLDPILGISFGIVVDVVRANTTFDQQVINRLVTKLGKQHEMIQELNKMALQALMMKRKADFDVVMIELSSGTQTAATFAACDDLILLSQEEFNDIKKRESSPIRVGDSVETKIASAMEHDMMVKCVVKTGVKLSEAMKNHIFDTYSSKTAENNEYLIQHLAYLLDKELEEDFVVVNCKDCDAPMFVPASLLRVKGKPQ